MGTIAASLNRPGATAPGGGTPTRRGERCRHPACL